jgi:presenilin-like A22 family membrane protease
LFIISRYIDIPKTAETGVIEHKPLPYDLQPPAVDKDISFVYVFISILFGTLILFALMRYGQIMLWKLWYLLAIFFSLLVAFSAFITQGYAAIAAIIIATLKTFRPSIIVHNFAELFIYGGLASFFVWIFNVKSAIILLILISIYDMYAVWSSKHMIKLAKYQAKSNMFAGLFVPYKLGGMSKPKQNDHTQKVKVKNAILGGGDIAFPLIFAGTVLESAIITMPLAQAIKETMLIPIFATIALSLLFYFSEDKKFYPAMPFITAGCFIGYAIMSLI